MSHITYESKSHQSFQPGIDSVLNRINHSLSPFEEKSIVSKINSNEEVELDDYFVKVYLEAKRISILTDGAYDITIGPLVNEWGFGTKERGREPSKERIDSIMQYVGFEKVAFMHDHIEKRHPEMKLDFSSIAKGYAVDKVAEYLSSMGSENYLIDIGGEVKAKGVNATGKSWKVGISTPTELNLDNSKVHEILTIHNKSLATSGNYRNYYEQDGKRYAHTIDPRKGYPVQHSLLSATILAESCMEADAVATACMVMGLGKSINFVEMMPEVEAYFIYSSENNAYEIYYTEGFRAYLQPKH